MSGERIELSSLAAVRAAKGADAEVDRLVHAMACTAGTMKPSSSSVEACLALLRQALPT